MRSSGHKALVAVDLGAQSCRVSLLRFLQGTPYTDVVHRFRNAPVVTPTGIRWDIAAILEGVEAGLRLCAGIATEGIDAIGIDGWAVDYVRLDEDGNHIANPFCYRDERTVAAEKEIHEILSPTRLYALTGIQLLRINTLYQLYADHLAGIDPAQRWLNLPEFVTSRLGGRPVAEYTNATHTQLVDLHTRGWCDEIFQSAGLDRNIQRSATNKSPSCKKLRRSCSTKSKKTQNLGQNSCAGGNQHERKIRPLEGDAPPSLRCG